jgi:hypothetical protein
VKLVKRVFSETTCLYTRFIYIDTSEPFKTNLALESPVMQCINGVDSNPAEGSPLNGDGGCQVIKLKALLWIIVGYRLGDYNAPYTLK